MVSAEKAGLRAGRPGAVRKGVRGWLTALPFILPGLILVAVFVLYPLLFTIRIALSDYQIVQGNITFIGLENFKKVLSGGSRFWYAYRNNFLYALVTVPFILLGGMLFAYLINNLRRGQGVFRVGFYLFFGRTFFQFIRRICHVEYYRRSGQNFPPFPLYSCSRK